MLVFKRSLSLLTSVVERAYGSRDPGAPLIPLDRLCRLVRGYLPMLLKKHNATWSVYEHCLFRWSWRALSIAPRRWKDRSYTQETCLPRGRFPSAPFAETLPPTVRLYYGGTFVYPIGALVDVTACKLGQDRAITVLTRRAPTSCEDLHPRSLHISSPQTV